VDGLRGEQRADMRMARLSSTILQPHMKPGSKIDAVNFMLYPDDANDIPDDVEDQERKWMIALGRAG
jgi:hypothetical protein